MIYSRGNRFEWTFINRCLFIFIHIHLYLYIIYIFVKTITFVDRFLVDEKIDDYCCTCRDTVVRSQFSTLSTFFAQSQSFLFCLMSSRLREIRNLFNFHHRMSLCPKRINRLVENRLRSGAFIFGWRKKWQLMELQMNYHSYFIQILVWYRVFDHLEKSHL